MDKKDWDKSIKLTFIVLFGMSLFWFLFSCQLLWAYDPGGAPLDLKKNSRMNDTILIQPGTGTSGGSDTARFRTYYGTQACVGVGVNGYLLSGTLTGIPYIDYLYGNGSSTLNFSGFTHVAVGGSDIPSASSVTGKIDAVGGTGTTNVFTDTTIAGQGTLTATVRTNGVDITPTEIGYLDGLSSNIQTQITGKQDSIGQSPLGSSIGSVTAALGSQSINAFNDVTVTAPANGQFFTYDGSAWINGTSSSSVAFSGITGIPTDNPYFSITQADNKVQYGIPTIYNLPATATTITGTSTNARWYNLQRTSTIDTGTITVDASPNNFTILTTGNVSATSTSAFGGQAIAFDGTGDYLSVADDPRFALIDFTFETNAYWTDVSAAHRVFFSQYDDASHLYVWRWDNVGSIQFYCENGTSTINFQTAWTPTVNTYYYLALKRAGSDIKLYVDATQIGTATDGTPLTNCSSNLKIGAGDSGGSSEFKGALDEVRISNIARTITHQAGEYVSDPNTLLLLHGGTSNTYNYNSLTCIPPGTVTATVKIDDNGTATTDKYFIADVSTVVFGVGTVTDAMKPYAGWFGGATRATAFNIASTQEIKDNIQSIKIKPDILDAEGMAKLNYIANNKIAWIAANGENYTTVVNETGTGSAIVVDTVTMESDYKAYIELEWAADMNQDTYTENIQKQHEKGFWKVHNSVTPKSWNPRDKPTLTRKGFVVEDMPTVVWGDDGKSLDLGSMLAYMTVVQKTLKEDTIFALSTLKELITTGTVTQQKIDYCNDRLEVLNP